MQVNFKTIDVVGAKSNYSAQNSTSLKQNDAQIMNSSDLSAYPKNYYLSFNGFIPATSKVDMDDPITYNEIKSIRSIDDLGDLFDKQVLLRVDFNVARDKFGNITDDTRIKEVLPTIKKLQNEGAKILLVSHLDKPKGQYNPSMSLEKVSQRLGKLMYKNVKFIPTSPYDMSVDKTLSEMKPGDIALLENIRFTPDEEGKDVKIRDDEGNVIRTLHADKERLAKRLASLSDVVVFDAFGAAHRDHASTAGVIRQGVPAAKGLLMEKELNFLSKLMIEPENFTAVIGGSKISTKIGVLEGLINKGDVKTIIIGGAMAHAFIQAYGYDIGSSYIEAKTDECDPVLEAIKVIKLAKKNDVKILLPLDAVVKNIEDEQNGIGSSKVVLIDEIPKGWAAYDIGPITVNLFASNLRSDAKTIFWNGPMGKFEEKGYDEGTNAVARLVSNATLNGAISVAGGGDTINAINSSGINPKTITHISTGGGASLEFVEGKMLPSVKNLILNSRYNFSVND